ncbi:MAG: FkbM family methyltransferase [Pseudolabrys sp.]
MFARAIKSILHRIGLDVVRYQAEIVDPVDRAFRALRKLRDDYHQVDAREAAFVRFCCEKMPHSKSQLFQDLFALFQLNEKHGGYFVEFGACDGIELSNTYLLESEYGWTGIVAEPAKSWHEKLRQNRSAAIDYRCVWAKSGETLTFNETPVRELSTINDFLNHDGRARRGLRSNGTIYPVDTVSLNDLLSEHKAPQQIDYLSVDTEGSEFTILSAFDFNRWQPQVVTVEHNHVEPTRSKIRSLMTVNGFRHVFSNMSAVDDWYVRR